MVTHAVSVHNGCGWAGKATSTSGLAGGASRRTALLDCRTCCRSYLSACGCHCSSHPRPAVFSRNRSPARGHCARVRHPLQPAGAARLRCGRGACTKEGSRLAARKRQGTRLAARRRLPAGATTVPASSRQPCAQRVCHLSPPAVHAARAAERRVLRPCACACASPPRRPTKPKPAHTNRPHTLPQLSEAWWRRRRGTAPTAAAATCRPRRLPRPLPRWSLAKRLRPEASATTNQRRRAPPARPPASTAGHIPGRALLPVLFLSPMPFTILWHPIFHSRPTRHPKLNLSVHPSSPGLPPSPSPSSF